MWPRRAGTPGSPPVKILTPGLLIGAYELDGVDLIPPRDDVGCERDFYTVGLEGRLGEFDHEIVQFRRGIVALPDGMGRALLIVNFNFDDRSRAAGLPNTYLSGVHRPGIFQIQPLNAAILGFRCPG